MIRVSIRALLFVCLFGLLNLSGQIPRPEVSPAVIARDAVSGRAAVRAVRLKDPLRMDGRLDEAVYRSVPAISDFVQMEPHSGLPATEKTELWILFDDSNVYVTFRCWETHPERMVVKEMRHDNSNLWMGENVAFMFDTFHDRRNGVEFGVTPSGGRYEGQVTNERYYYGDWNPVWTVAVGRFQGGWIAETAIPFKSLRYRPGRAQVWGFQARRINAWKNELSFLTQLPPALGMGRGIFAASLAPSVVGLEAPDHTKNLEIKPYARGDMTTNNSGSPPISNQWKGDAGVDVKYGPTQNLTTDLTYNPDFSQVEADDQQVNLTRFSLFYPEKREFFLENQGLFAFGGVGSADVPILFYSRRIGINQGQAVPIEAGGRLIERVGRFSLGVLDIESGNQEQASALATNFSVLRVKRDILRRSSVGLIATERSVSASGSARNTVYGADATFVFFDNLSVNTYWARAKTSSISRDDISYRAQLDYSGDRYGVQLERLAVGSNFNPEIGFVRRGDMRKNFGYFRFSPRPQNTKHIRKLYFDGSAAYITNGAGHLETKDFLGEFAIDFQNSDHFTAQHERDYEFAPRPFAITAGMTLPVAGYKLETTRAGYTLGPQRHLSGSVLVEYGPFYGGRRAAVTVSGSRVNAPPRLSVEPTYSIDQVTLPEGNFTTHLAGARATFTVTPLMFISSLIQYNSTTQVVSANVRFRWEYRPGSEFFVVYNEERTNLGPAMPALKDGGLVVKINRLLRF